MDGVVRGNRKPFWVPEPVFRILSDSRLALLTVLFVAVVLRFGALFYFGPAELEGDVPSYVTPGVRLATGLGYTRMDGLASMRRAPGFPLQIAFSYWLTGGLYLASLLNAVWGAVAVWAVYVLGKKAFGGPAVGALAAITYAALPQPIHWQRFLLSESLHTMLILLWAIVILDALEAGGLPRFVLAGLILAAALYTRPASALLVPAVPVLALFFRATRARAGWVLLSSVVAVLAIVPWTIRNYRASGRVIPIATGIGTAAYLGNLGDGGAGTVSADYAGAVVREDVIRAYEAAANRSDWEADAYAASLVPGLLQERLTQDFWGWLVHAKLANVSRFFFGIPIAFSPPWWSYYQSAVVAGLLLLTSLSFPDVWRRVNPNAPLLFCWMLASLLPMHIATTSVRRYSEPVIPFLVIGFSAALCGYGPAWWNRLVLQGRTRNTMTDQKVTATHTAT
jgi:4-amino-4-deoxy-L-arabinose transferase-like glycosyltransferase